MDTCQSGKLGFTAPVDGEGTALVALRALRQPEVTFSAGGEYIVEVEAHELFVATS